MKTSKTLFLLFPSPDTKERETFTADTFRKINYKFKIGRNNYTISFSNTDNYLYSWAIGNIILSQKAIF